MGLLPIFFGDIAQMAWPGQFNLDFLGFLLLSGFWLAWRHAFSPGGLALGVRPTTERRQRRIDMPAGLDRTKIARQVAAIALAALASWVVLNGSFAVLREIWPDYAQAQPDRAYTLPMLFVRLIIFSSMIAATSAVATLVARSERFAWIAGGLILAYSIPPHLYPGTVWEFYPPWYHIVYLLSILPIAVVAGRLAISGTSPK